MTNNIKLVSWNVNGIRACIKKGFFDYLEEERPSIIGLQEVKAKPHQIESELDKIKDYGYSVIWNDAMRPGYSGTAILTNIKYLSYNFGIYNQKIDYSGIENYIDDTIKDDYEGRVITLELEDFYYVTVYTPNSKRGLLRLDYRQIWDEAFYRYINFLEKKKPVIFCGDLNVAHTDIDLARPKTNRRNAGFTDEEKIILNKFIDSNFIDTFRYFYPNLEGMYSWWSNFAKSRENNVGWRIDYFLASANLKTKLDKAEIRTNQLGSDHCPVILEIKDVKFNKIEKPILKGVYLDNKDQENNNELKLF